MTRQQVYKQMEDTFGLVPSMFKSLPESTLETEWQLFKKTEMDKGLIPEKYRSLIGLGIAATIRCRYCTLHHTEMAKVNGASDAEIEEAVHFAKSVAGWSTYINGLQIDYDKFKSELMEICDHVRLAQPVRA